MIDYDVKVYASIGFLNMPVDREALEVLLTSHDFQAFEDEVARQAGMKVVANELWRVMHRALGDLSAADIQPGEVAGYLAANRDAAAKFILALQTRPEAHPDGEFPEGEEPDPDEVDHQVELIGLARGFSIGFAIYALLIAATGPDKLTPYLKNRRIPFAKKEARHFREVLAQTHPAGVQRLQSEKEGG